MFRHGLCLLGIPCTQHLRLTDNSQSLVQTKLGSTHFQTYRTLELRLRAQLTLTSQHAIRKG